MAGHPIYEDDMQEIVESFIVEGREILDDLDHDLVVLEQHADDRNLIDRVFRSVHTLKGMAGFLSLDQLSVLAHHFEEVLDQLRRQELEVQLTIMDILLDASDHMRRLLQQVIDRDLQPLNLDSLLAKLKALSGGTFPGTATGTAVAGTVGSPGHAAVASSQDRLLMPEAAASGRVAETIRVEVSRLDNLMDLVGELVLGRNRLLQLVSEVGAGQAPDELLQELTTTSAQVDFITTELQAAVMQTRMVQIGRVFHMFPRIVRDLARKLGKEIELVTEAEETELDKQLVEEIGSPLVHLIRNAADHGIEEPEVRTARGKPTKGFIRLAASQEGNTIVIEVEDDGAGMDPTVIKQQALEKQLITAHEADEMSEADLLQLIFRPGFSTAQQVSQISGRGVGMDVVKTNLARLNGSIDIESTLGRGTRFILRLPLRLAIIQSLLVRVGDETFAIPCMLSLRSSASNRVTSTRYADAR